MYVVEDSYSDDANFFNENEILVYFLVQLWCIQQ